jgi:hypothetical protein
MFLISGFNKKNIKKWLFQNFVFYIFLKKIQIVYFLIN